MPGKRYSRGEARAALLDAGIELAVDRGPSLGLELVTFADAIDRSGVPRPSAYRAFSDDDKDPQDHFRRELANCVVHGCSFSDLEAVAADCASLIDEANEDGRTASDLSWLLREFIRVACNSYQLQCRADLLFPAYFSILVASTYRDDRLLSDLRAQEDQAAKGFADFYRVLLQLFGLRLHNDWTLPRFVAAVNMVQTGEYLMSDVLDMQPFPRPTGRSGESQDWTMFSLIMESVFASATEPDPKMIITARPDTWTS